MSYIYKSLHIKNVIKSFSTAPQEKRHLLQGIENSHAGFTQGLSCVVFNTQDGEVVLMWTEEGLDRDVSPVFLSLCQKISCEWHWLPHTFPAMGLICVLADRCGMYICVYVCCIIMTLLMEGRCNVLKMICPGTGQLSQIAECLQYKHEDLNLDPYCPQKC